MLTICYNSYFLKNKMRVFFTCFFLLFSIAVLFSSCSPKSDDNTTENSTENISISSSPSDNSTLAFGQTYLHQVTSTGTYSGVITYSLSNQPDGMTISNTGLVEWTPTKASQITTHSNITITLTTASGYAITQTFDLTVTGTCIAGNVLAIWTGDQRISTDSSKFLGNITAYTDNASDNCGQNDNSDCTASNNYEYHTTNVWSESLHIGPATSADDGIMFFYNQYDNTTHIYLFWMFGKGGATVSPTPNNIKLDLFAANNESSDNVVVTDDSGETSRVSQTSSSPYSSTYTGRYAYGSGKSDGGVIGPFSGTAYRIFVDLAGKSSLTSSHSHDSSEDLVASDNVSGYDLGTGNLDSFVYWSKDNSSFSLGNVDNFTVGYKTSMDCSN